MVVQTGVSLEEYLHTSYDGLDREFRDGEVVERSMPDLAHSECQWALAAYFGRRRKELGLSGGPELRLRMPAKRVLIPDFSIFHGETPKNVPDTPPLVAIEILSPGDRLSEARAKLEEYRDWGVPHVWLVDPHARRFYTLGEKLVEVESLRIDSLGIEIFPADIFD